MQLADAAMPTSPPSACCPHLQRRQCCELMAGFLHLQDCPHAIGVACFVATAVCPGAACCPPPSKPFFSCCFLLLGSHSPCTRHVSGGSGTAKAVAGAVVGAAARTAVQRYSDGNHSSVEVCLAAGAERLRMQACSIPAAGTVVVGGSGVAQA